MGEERPGDRDTWRAGGQFSPDDGLPAVHAPAQAPGDGAGVPQVPRHTGVSNRRRPGGHQRFSPHGPAVGCRAALHGHLVARARPALGGRDVWDRVCRETPAG